MKQIGAEIGVNESRVSQLHARAIRRLREALGQVGAQQAADMRSALIEFAAQKAKMAKATLMPPVSVRATVPKPAMEPAAALAAIANTSPAREGAVVLPYKAVAKRRAPLRAPLKVARTRQVVAAAR
jgi:hypothetical protein